MKQKLLLVFGTRPEAIKMAPLVKKLRQIDEFNVAVCNTGQHSEMLDQVLTVFDIFPDFDLKIMQKGQDLYDVSAKVLLGMRSVLASYKPDLVLVHGDTVTAMSASLAALYQKIPIAHIEAGLRTQDIYNPWPEEMNRQLMGRLASFHFAPTMTAKENLLRENVKDKDIIVTGNTVIDALNEVLTKINHSPLLEVELTETLFQSGYDTDRLNKGKRLVLITGHRRENFGEGFISICLALKTLAEKYPAIDFVYPVHLNPNVQSPVKEILSGSINENIFLIHPLEYFPFVFLMKKSYLILTDSGGLQEEAPSLGKPVLVMRETTERPEAVLAGTVKLVGTNTLKIIHSVSELLDDNLEYQKMAKAVNPYGNGKSSEKIVNFLVKYFTKV